MSCDSSVQKEREMLLVQSQNSSINIDDSSEIQPNSKLKLKMISMPTSDDASSPLNGSAIKELVKNLNPDSAEVSPINYLPQGTNETNLFSLN